MAEEQSLNHLSDTDRALAEEARAKIANRPKVEIVNIALQDLEPVAWNPRQISSKDKSDLKRSLEKFGCVEPLIVREHDKSIVGGHQRYFVALELGWPDIPCVIIDITENEAKLLNIALNKISGEWDVDKLNGVLADLAVQEEQLMLSGFDDAEMAAMGIFLDPTLNPSNDPDHIPDPPDAAISQKGDLWILGAHRLLCGDAGSTEDLDRLLAGATIDLLACDPPYNVKVEPRSSTAIAAGNSSFPEQQKGMHHQGFDQARGASPKKAAKKKMRAKDRPLENDFITDDAFAAMLLAWFGNGARVLKKGGSFYIWGGYANLGNYPAPLKACGLYFSQGVVWDKQHPVLTRKDFMGAFEICFYGWKEGAAHNFYGPHNIPDLWHVKKIPPQKMEHLTAKPVDLAVMAINYSTLPGQSVLDLFGGSGSTLIGCEQTGRIGYTMEMDTLYCDLIVDRFQRYTGVPGVLDRTGNSPIPMKPREENMR